MIDKQLSTVKKNFLQTNRMASERTAIELKGLMGAMDNWTRIIVTNFRVIEYPSEVRC